MVKRLIGVLMVLFVVAGCSSNSVVAEDKRISNEYKKDYHEFTVYYESRINKVRLENIPLESGITYYVKEGSYTLEYEYKPKVTFGVEVAYKSRSDKGSDNRDTMEVYLSKEEIEVHGKTEMVLEGKNIGVNFTGEVGN